MFILDNNNYFVVIENIITNEIHEEEFENLQEALDYFDQQILYSKSSPNSANHDDVIMVYKGKLKHLNGDAFKHDTLIGIQSGEKDNPDEYRHNFDCGEFSERILFEWVQIPTSISDETMYGIYPIHKDEEEKVDGDIFYLNICFSSKAVLKETPPFLKVTSDRFDNNPSVEFIEGLPRSVKAELIKEAYKRIPSIIKFE